MNRINKVIIQSNHFINFNRIAIFLTIIGTIIVAACLSGT
jgi:hypothetical protein